MKKIAVFVLSFICVLALSGCNKDEETMYLEGIMVNGVFYEIADQPMSAEIDESAIIGYVSSYTESEPAKDGETNISEDLIGAPFAEVEGGIVLLYQNEWYMCTTETEED